MKLVIGLGNPGEKYGGTRHNVGFEMVEGLLEKVSNSQVTSNKQIPNSKFQVNKRFEAEIARIGDVLLTKPQTFMNESGRSVRKVMDFYKIVSEDLWVIHDDLDIRLGEYKIQQGVGPKVHNGVNDIEEKLGETGFWRVRIGVDSRTSREIPGDEYVLNKFRLEEQKTLDEVIISVVEELCRILNLS